MASFDRCPAFVWILGLLAPALTWPAGHPASASQDFTFTKMILKGDAAPGTEEGTVFGPLTGLYFPALPNLDESGQFSFAATLEGPSVDSSNRTGVWSGVPGAVSLIARAGDEAPDAAPARLASFPLDFALFPPATGAGRLGYAATLTGSDVQFTNDEGVWLHDSGEPFLLAREGDPAPGLPDGTVFMSPLGLEINPAGHVFFASSVNGPGVSSDNDDAFWSDRDGALAPLLREGDPAPGMDEGVTFGGAGQYVGTGYSFESFRWSSASGLGIHANITGPGVTTFDNEALWFERAGELTLLAREGDRAPGFSDGATFGGNSVTADFGAISYNALEQAAFSGRVGPSAIYPIFSNHTGSSLSLIARPGDPAPGTDQDFGILADPKLSDGGRIAFRSALSGSGSWPPLGVWWDVPGLPGELSALVVPGDPAPGRPNVTISSVSRLHAFTADGHLVLEAVLDDPAVGSRTALLLARPTGELEEIVATRDLFDVQGSAGGGTDIREVTAVAFAAMNETAQMAIRLDFADERFGFYLVSSPTASLPDRTDRIVRFARNSPNPFSSTTRIEFELAKAARTDVSVFDTQGRLVRRVPGAARPAGRHSLFWDGRDATGAEAPSGVYWARFDAGTSSPGVRMVLLRR